MQKQLLDKEAINLERSWEGAGKSRSDAVIVLIKFKKEKALGSAVGLVSS